MFANNDPAPENECYWPHNQDYASICMHCEETFYGPKRAPSCWKRQGAEGKAWWLGEFNSPVKEAKE